MSFENSERLRNYYPKIEFPNIDAAFQEEPTHIIIYSEDAHIKSFMIRGCKGKTGIANSVDASLVSLNDIILTNELEKYTDLPFGSSILDSHIRGGEKIAFYNEKQPIIPRNSTEKIYNLRVEKSFSGIYQGFKENIRRL